MTRHHEKIEHRQLTRLSGGSALRAFTMIELLVVMVVVTILMAIAAPSFERLSVGSGVDAAARSMGAQLRLARQYAITHRKRVAVLMPSNSGGPTSKAYTAYRPCIVDVARNFLDWIPSTQWEYLPKGAVIAEADRDVAVDESGASFTVQDDGEDLILDIDEDGDGSTDYTDVRAVIFKPTGRIVGLDVYVSIFEGFPAQDGSGVTIKRWNNYRIVAIDPYTGRISYRKHAQL